MRALKFPIEQLSFGGSIKEIKAADKPTIIVFNKIDSYSLIEKGNSESEEDSVPTLEELKRTWMARLNNKNVIYLIIVQMCIFNM